MSEVILDRVSVLEKFLRGRSAVEVGIPWTKCEKDRFRALETSSGMCGWGVDVAIPGDPKIPGKYCIIFREAFPTDEHERKYNELAVYLKRDGSVRMAELRRCVLTQGAAQIESPSLFYPSQSKIPVGEELALIDGLLLAMKLHGQEHKANSRRMQWQL